MDRVKFWLSDDDTEGYDLFKQMYESRIKDGRLYMTQGIKALVDNDCVNWTWRCRPGSEEYRKCKRAYNRNEKRLPVALADDRTIEAYSNGVFLISC